MTYIAPSVFAGKFSCPHCAAITQQHWWFTSWDNSVYADPKYCELRVGKCLHCQKRTFWIEDKMYFPATGTAPNPNSEMPESVRELYREAASIQSPSPRASAALLRLAVQVLCKELGEEGKNIDQDIAALVKKGLPAIVQQSLDVIRVTGNHAVHPGQIDTDDPEVVGQLFLLLNVICEYMIAMPKKVSGLYASLPARAIEAIKKRDA